LSVIASNAEIDELVAEIKRIRNFKKTLAEQEDNLMQKLYNYMSENEELVNENGELLLSWKYAKDSQYFDAKRFQIDNPDVYNNYLALRNGARRLVIK